MGEYVKAFFISPLVGPVVGLLVVMVYSLKWPDPYYVASFLGLGTLLSYIMMTIVGFPLVYLLIRMNLYSLPALLICAIVVSILLTAFYLLEKDTTMKLWFFVNSVLLVSSVSVCATFWLIAKK